MRWLKAVGVGLVIAFMMLGIFASLPSIDAGYWKKIYSWSGSRDVHEGYYLYWHFTVSGASEPKLEYTIVVSDGPAIDVFVMTEEGYYHYRNGESFLYYTAASVQNTYYASISWYIPGDGTYYIVVDNTDAGEAQPPWNGVDDVANVEYDIALYEYVESDGSSGGSSGGTGGGMPPGGGTGGSSGNYYSSSMDWLWPLVAILIIVVVIVIVVAAVAASKKSKTPQTPVQTRYQPSQTQQQPVPPWVKYCPKCGREIPNDANVCPYCGYKF